MNSALLYSSIFALIIGLLLQAIGIRIAHRLNLLDMPTARRRHRAPIPIIGGIGIFITLGLAITFYMSQAPAPDPVEARSLAVMGLCITLLIILGLFDDLRGLGPGPKLGVELILASAMLAFEPKLHEVCLHWQEIIGPVVWILGVLWIVGITNAINLIDGLDGLAGGTAAFASASILTLSIWSGPSAEVGTLITGLLIPSILAFLFYNWAPARVFLGDNGSLPLGFILACVSLTCRPQNRSWIMVASVTLMLGYPILDTGLAVWRRFRSHLPLFKADRSHLHFRILRLGLSVPHTAMLLLSISAYLQISAVCINLMPTPAAVMGIGVLVFSLFSLIYLIRGIERWRVLKAYDSTREDLSGPHPESKVCQTMSIDIEPLLESGLLEEKARLPRLASALLLMVETLTRAGDIVISSNQRITIVFVGTDPGEDGQRAIQLRYESKIKDFLELYNLQCSLSSLPVTFERKSFVLARQVEARAEAKLQKVA